MTDLLAKDEQIDATGFFTDPALQSLEVNSTQLSVKINFTLAIYAFIYSRYICDSLANPARSTLLSAVPQLPQYNYNDVA